VGESKHTVTIADREKIVFSVLKPPGPGQCLTFRAMSVLTGVIGYLDMSALVTLADVTSHSGCSPKQDDDGMGFALAGTPSLTIVSEGMYEHVTGGGIKCGSWSL
jgi:hypothetical protein